MKLRPAAVAVIFAALTLLKLLCCADSVSRTKPAGESTTDYVAALGRSLTSEGADEELREAFAQLLIGDRTEIRQTFRGDA